jgi:hypothetical protein
MKGAYLQYYIRFTQLWSVSTKNQLNVIMIIQLGTMILFCHDHVLNQIVLASLLICGLECNF